MRAQMQANRGRALEELIELANNQYLVQGRAVIHKVPTEWIPVRDGTGKIRTAKVERKAAVDFIGAYGGQPIAFDAKETRADRIRWDRVELHQQKFLECWHRAGGIAFVIVGFMARERFFVVPWPVWRRGLERWRDERGPASVSYLEFVDWGCEAPSVLEYLSVVDKVWGTRYGGDHRMTC